jgi:predicted ester cyclase
MQAECPQGVPLAARAAVNDNGWDDDPVADDELGGIAVGVRELVERFYERLWNAWDDDAVEGILAEDFKFRGSLGQQTVGRDGWRAYRDQVRAAAPDFSNELVELVVDGDRAAARLRCVGTHRGLLLGLAGTGRASRTTLQHSSVRRAGSWLRPGSLADLADLRRQLTESQ